MEGKNKDERSCFELSREHNLIFECFFVNKQYIRADLWYVTDRREWIYYKVDRCLACSRKELTKITMEEYLKGKKNES